jgi:hypothetical protein
VKPRILCYFVSAALLLVLPFAAKKPLRPCSADEQAQQLTELFEYQQAAPGWLSTPLAIRCSPGSVSWSDLRRSGPAALGLMWRPLTFALFVVALSVAFLGELLYGAWLLILSRRHLKGKQQSV